MIYQTNSIKYLVFSIRRQQGVTLLLGILVLAAVMSIAFSMATILLTEVRVSGDMQKTEPAFYAANAVSEEALFAIRRGFIRCSSGSCANQFFYTTQLGGVKMDNPIPAENLYSDPIFQDKVESSSDSFERSKNIYALYDPSNINAPSGFSKLKVTYKNTGALGQIHVYVCEFKAPADFYEGDPPIDCNSAGSSDMIYKDTTPLSPGLTSVAIILNPSRLQEIRIYGDASPSADRYIQIQAYDSGGNPKGIPYYGSTVVDINAQYGGVNRALRVDIPK